MLASAMGQASTWDSKSSLEETHERMNTSDEDLDDDDDDDDMETESDDEVETETEQDQTQDQSPNAVAMHTQGVSAIETVLLEHQRRIREETTNNNSRNMNSNSDTTRKGSTLS